MTFKRKLIEVALPLDVINAESAREKSIRHGHPSTLHLWWARRPLAAARAVLWSSLVDDPSSHPDKFPTEELQEVERQRLFRILEELVKWENSNNEQVLDAAKAEIVASCDGDLPKVLDPFCGGGTIPLEAQRLGLEALGGDLNPVAVLISKAMVEIPPRFAGMPPINPASRADSGLKTWERAQGLAEDVRYYGKWMRDRAFERIGHLYPKVELPAEQGGGEATVIAWIWARTVESPDPSWSGHVPLVRSWILRKAKKGKPVVWVEPVIDRETQTITYQIREGGTPIDGTIGRSTGGRCIATGAPFDFKYVREWSRAHSFGSHLLAVVADGHAGRSYISSHNLVDMRPSNDSAVDADLGSLPNNPRDFKTPGYGMKTWQSLFSTRQFLALSAFTDLMTDVRQIIESDAVVAHPEIGERLRDGGTGAAANLDALATYLAFVVDKCADYWSTICTWHNREYVRNTFARQAIPMTWDFAETNPFSDSTGNWMAMVDWVANAVERLPAKAEGKVGQRDAAVRVAEAGRVAISTDPPYYDNVSYSDLSDFFYVWMRRTLRDVWPDELSTVLTPKAEELVADRYRAGSAQAAKDHFESGIEDVFSQVANAQDERFPTTVFYAFKQSETDDEGTASTGWETFLDGILQEGLSVHSTWPMRTEMGNRMIASGKSALASSIVLSCRPRSAVAPLASTVEFRAALRAELPAAIRVMQKGAIAPVDLAQSAIGPGMAVFSRFSKVVEADGAKMSVRRALQIINEVLDEVVSEEETEFDADTRWAVTWYRQFGLSPGPYGTAETLSKAKNTSVAGVVEAGFGKSHDGKVWLLGREDLDPEWDPGTDKRSTVWEATQHLVRSLETSESEAGDLRQRLGGTANRARQLAYLLYRVAEQKGWAQEAVAYNSLVVAWPELERLAGQRQPEQQILGGAS